MTNHRRTRRPRRRPRLRTPVVLAVAVLLAAGSAVGLYAAHATGHLNLTGQSALTAHSRHVSHPPASRHKGRPKPRRVPAAVTPAPTATHSSATSAPSTTSAPTSSPTPAGGSTTTAPAASTSCSGAANTPGGPDPWGGCWPGPDNTGVPSGISLTTYSGPCEIRVPNVVIDAKTVNCALDIEAPGAVIQDSKINGPVHNNSSGTLVIKDSEIDGGNDTSETVGGDNITITGSNLHGDQHEFHCGTNCTVEDSWLHDNYNFGPSDHENGFLSNGGSNYVVQHNSVYCVGGCTGDITFIPDDSVSNATVDKNLLVATHYAAFCLYPASDHPAKPGVVSGMVITDNVFQRGPNGTCAYYGPTYGWDSSNTSGNDGYGNVWSGNMWDNGKPLASP